MADYMAQNPIAQQAFFFIQQQGESNYFTISVNQAINEFDQNGLTGAMFGDLMLNLQRELPSGSLLWQALGTLAELGNSIDI